MFYFCTFSPVMGACGKQIFQMFEGFKYFFGKLSVLMRNMLVI